MAFNFRALFTGAAVPYNYARVNTPYQHAGNYYNNYSYNYPATTMNLQRLGIINGRDAVHARNAESTINGLGNWGNAWQQLKADFGAIFGHSSGRAVSPDPYMGRGAYQRGYHGGFAGGLTPYQQAWEAEYGPQRGGYRPGVVATPAKGTIIEPAGELAAPADKPPLPASGDAAASQPAASQQPAAAQPVEQPAAQPATQPAAAATAQAIPAKSLAEIMPEGADAKINVTAIMNTAMKDGGRVTSLHFEEGGKAPETYVMMRDKEGKTTGLVHYNEKGEGHYWNKEDLAKVPAEQLARIEKAFSDVTKPNEDVLLRQGNGLMSGASYGSNAPSASLNLAQYKVEAPPMGT